MEITLMKTKAVPQVTIRSNAMDVDAAWRQMSTSERKAAIRAIGSDPNSQIINMTPSQVGGSEGEALRDYIRQTNVNSKANEKSWPKSYSCNFLEAGAVSYEDVKQGVALLKKESMDTWIQSFVGKPVIIDHQDVDPSNFKNAAVGYITRVWFEPADGWFWCEFIITDDEGHEAIKDGYSVSCSFDVVNTAGGGEWHAIKYDEEIIQGAGLHLALVTTPRYEDCRIMVNSKGKAMIKGNATDFSIMSPLAIDKYMGALSDVGLQTIIDGEYDEEVKKVAKAHTGDRAKKKEEEMVAAAKGQGEKKNTVELTKKGGSMKWKLFAKKGEKIENDKIDASKVFVQVDGEMVPLSTLMNSVGPEFQVLEESDTVKINGKDVKIGDLVAAHKANDKKAKCDDDKKKVMDDAMNAFENAKNEFEKEKSDDKKKVMDDAKKVYDDAKKNWDEEEKKKKEDDKKADDEKKNAEEKEKKEDGKDKEEDPEKKNAKKGFFVDLNNARNVPIETGSSRGGADTREDKATRGKKYFGSHKKSA